MADLNSTIVRGSLRVTEDINTNGNITLSNVKNTKVLGTDANGLLEAHTLGISDITNLQTTLDNKQNKITYPCSFEDSNGDYVNLSRYGASSSYYVKIERGSVTYYSDSTTQYPSINVTFPSKFSDTPTVIVTFAPTSDSTGTYEALKVINVTSTGFVVKTMMATAISGGYFKVNWIAIRTV